MAYIVIADDDELIAEVASSVLIDAGHACGWVTDGEKARDLLRWRRPDLLLLDNDMPGITGSGLLRELRSSAEFYDLPVMMFTKASSQGDEAAARLNGAQDFIRKPFDPTNLVFRVERLLVTREERPQHKTLSQYLRETAGYEPEEERRRAVF